MVDLLFMERIARWLTNTQVKIKAEVADSNSEARRCFNAITDLHQRIDACERPNPDKPVRSLTHNITHSLSCSLTCSLNQFSPHLSVVSWVGLTFCIISIQTFFCIKLTLGNGHILFCFKAPFKPATHLSLGLPLGRDPSI